MKRIFAFALVLLMLLMTACGEKAADNNAGEPEPTPEQQGGPAVQNTDEEDDGFPILGLILNDDGSDRANLTMYGFLRTAETLGYASKVFRASDGDGAKNAVEQAKNEGVTAVMIFDPNGKNTAAFEIAAGYGMKVVASYYQCAVSDISAQVIADNDEYYDELARGLAERMVERSLKSGRILVYGRDTAEALAKFDASIKANYPQFIVCEFQRTKDDGQAAIDELADFILNNRDIRGLYAVDVDSSAIAVEARSKAQKTFKSSGAPTPAPTPDATPAPGDTPAYVPNPALLTQIMVTVFGNGLSEANYKLFNDNDIYALCIEPYYEAAAQGTMTLDRLVRGESAASVSKVNRPIVYSDTADKYTAIYEQMKAAFKTED